MMTMSAAGVTMLAGLESVVLRAYRDPRGILTIGAGHTTAGGPPTVTPGMTITQDEALTILSRDVAGAEAAVNRHVKAPLTQPEFDALTSFAFNLGETNFAKSDVLVLLNDGKPQAAADALLGHDTSAGQHLAGLRTRREVERELFLSGTYPALDDAHPATPVIAVGERGKRVELLQKALQFLGHDVGPAGADGDFGGGTKAAVMAFQRAHGLEPDGRVGKATCSRLWVEVEAALEQPQTGSTASAGRVGEQPWMPIARGLVGVHEAPGAGDNPVILGWAREMRAAGVLKVPYAHDETPWCALFAGYVLWKAGYEIPGTLLAIDFAKWGRPSQLVPGAILVFRRQGGNHVTFLDHIGPDGSLYCLGGNQSDAVNVHRRTDKPIAVRMPPGAPVTAPPAAAPPLPAVRPAPQPAAGGPVSAQKGTAMDPTKLLPVAIQLVPALAPHLENTAAAPALQAAGAIVQGLTGAATPEEAWAAIAAKPELVQRIASQVGALVHGLQAGASGKGWSLPSLPNMQFSWATATTAAPGVICVLLKLAGVQVGQGEVQAAVDWAINGGAVLSPILTPIVAHFQARRALYTPPPAGAPAAAPAA